MHRKYLALILATLFALVGISMIFNGVQLTASLKVGSTGDLVTQVQRKLKNWGYLSGEVDGIYGSETQEAVRYFQRSNGLTADGIVGPATASALGITLNSASSSGGGSSSTQNNGDVYLLARAIYGEARGEPYIGQVAVGAVILNRVNSSKFPNSISGVIYQPGAFSVVSDGQINLTPDETALRAARDAMNGWDPSGGSLYYFNPAKTSNAWIWSRPVVTVIGNHRFCK